MSIKKVAIIGYGYVGKAYRKFFEDSYEVRIFDPAYPDLGASKERINECDLAVICVPTPMGKNGRADLTALKETFEWLDTPLEIIKSAVPPGTVDTFGRGTCVSPEYIGESSYFTPYWKYPHPTMASHHNFFVIGGKEPQRSKIAEFFLSVMGPDCKVIKMTAIEAEIVKYMENSWGATKVTFANEFYEICKTFGADYQAVREGFLADSRVERMHTMVLSGKRGFGGKCFPKDVHAIVEESTLMGYNPKLLRQVLESNKEFTELNESDGQ